MSRPGVDLGVFWGHVERGDDDAACWIWTGASSKPTPSAAEYGKYGTRGVSHRVAYELEVGPIPEGLELDHLCLNTMCVNPAHLEPVTRLENMRRRFALITHCKRGHELTDENRIGDSKRCLQCSRDRDNERYWNKIRPTRDVDRLKRECKNGHARTDDNTYITPAGHRQCRACKRERAAASIRTRRAQADGAA